MNSEAVSEQNKFIARDLSWLEFNGRVLEEAADTENPLLERLKFIAIFMNNLDEFLMVRFSGLKNLIAGGYNAKDSFGYLPQDLFPLVKAKIGLLNKRLYSLYHEKIKAELEKNKIVEKKAEQLSAEQKRFVKKYFDTELFPIVTPIAVDQGRPFPVLPSKTIAFAVLLSRYSSQNLAIIPVPEGISRAVELPSEKDEFNFILVEEILRMNLENFFRGYKLCESSLFRIVRDSEILVDEEYAPNLLRAIESEVKKRSRANVIYMEAEKNCSSILLEMLSTGLGYPQQEVAQIEANMDLTYLFDLIKKVPRTELTFQSFVPGKREYENIFEKISEEDLLLHMPYQSFDPTVDLIRSAANDDNVLAIKMTLYRTNEGSAIVQALKEAAKRKKQVTVVVEIKARFDEERNINWVKELEEAGCHVMYGIAGMKIHSKITLVVRKQEGKIRRYVHLSTGNYNETTSKIYTDLGYFTVNDDFAKDISDVFNMITGYSVPSRWKRIIASPYDLRQYFCELIDQEIAYQKKYKNGFIFAKMNSLEDPRIIEKLYEASSAGVKIKLIVRGICCLLPGVAQISENIEVRSIVGRFLEHSRIYLFNNNGMLRVFLSSADWMRRNLDHRIELLFEIYKDELKEYLKFVMDTCWKDNLKAWNLLPDASYIKNKKDGEKFNAQEFLIKHHCL
ncbi:MAG: polyphosphate kinase 1 [Candidatus Omnitrophica bacterium]|nr:polyphosphate kinase 1 [Candidatus Omnitrophota bacterium]